MQLFCHKLLVRIGPFPLDYLIYNLLVAQWLLAASGWKLGAVPRYIVIYQVTFIRSVRFLRCISKVHGSMMLHNYPVFSLHNILNWIRERVIPGHVGWPAHDIICLALSGLGLRHPRRAALRIRSYSKWIRLNILVFTVIWFPSPTL